MKSPREMSDSDWARRVNRTWLVRGDINLHASAWLEHLAARNDKRLEKSCKLARSMCGLRHLLEDPKPWFYAGLFSLATTEEACQFLATHRITRAAVPAMADDEDTNLWINRVEPETTDLLQRLRRGIASLIGETELE